MIFTACEDNVKKRDIEGSHSLGIDSSLIQPIYKLMTKPLLSAQMQMQARYIVHQFVDLFEF